VPTYPAGAPTCKPIHLARFLAALKAEESGTVSPPSARIRLSAAALLACDSASSTEFPELGTNIDQMSKIVEQDELGLDLGIRDAHQTDSEMRIPAALRR
jgi:hypothetical protein